MPWTSNDGRRQAARHRWSRAAPSSTQPLPSTCPWPAGHVAGSLCVTLGHEGQVLRHHESRGRARGGAPRRLGDRAEPPSREPAVLRAGHGGRDRCERSGASSRSSGCSSNPTLDEVGAAAEDESLTMVQLHGDEGPAFCREAATAHRLQGDQGVARAKRRRHPGRPRPTAPTSTCSTPTGPGRPAAPVRASTGSCSPAAAPRCR